MTGAVAVRRAGVKGSEVRTSLSDRYELERGRVFMTGVQALVRVLIDQHRADSRQSLTTASLVSGYQGSPLAGFDKEVAGLGPIADAHRIVHRPGVNEELGATAVWGSQLAATMPGRRYDGVVGVWYGKAPGVDRAADAIRHGNHIGTDPKGGVIALCGDDPACKSSTIPSASESLLAALDLPVLAPGTVQEALDMGRHAIALSRASGLWAALKVVTSVADATATVDVGLDRVNPRMPQIEWEGAPYVHRPSAHLLPPGSLEMERTIAGVRLELAEAYARLNGLNRIEERGSGAALGIAASGTAYHELRRALDEIDPGAEAPVRLLQVGMLHPLDRETVQRFASGLEEIVVVEEKRGFLEGSIKETLYGRPGTPRIVGKRDERGHPLIAAHGALDSDAIARAIAPRLLAFHELPRAESRLAELREVSSRAPVELGVVRKPSFCSGCPHNSSTVAADDELVGAGIGCHTMIMLAPGGHGNVVGATQMGGEGAQWIGAAPFVDAQHFTQNLGDGTFHHSGSLAVRAAVAAGVDVTYKLLFNGTVAMTGGQDVEGGMAIDALCRSLEAEGVRRIVVTSDDPDRLEGLELPSIAEVRDRSEIPAVERELADAEGVTVLLHDQACAAELRRARKRGTAPDPAERVVINERVCEGCGDCKKTSGGCLSVEPVETEFGTKTQINQTSCNKDYTCLDGDCPSFLTVVPAEGAGKAAAPSVLEAELPEPELTRADEVRIRLIGIGGTGVVTVSQVLGMAALLDGRHASGLDQTGLSQKAGPVVSDLLLSAGPAEDGVGMASGRADVVIGLDLLGATAANLRVADPERTLAVFSTSIAPTADMTTDADSPRPAPGAALRAIEAATRAGDDVFLDAAEIAERLLGDATQANVLVLGAAWQSGAIPVSLEALREAFRLNGVAVERNLAALEWGRAWVARRDLVDAALGADEPAASIDPRVTAWAGEHLADAGPELRHTLEVRVDDLIGWGGIKVARRYAHEMLRIRAEVEAAGVPEGEKLVDAAARGLHKLTAYKDEYEVARLHLEGLDELPEGAKVHFHLHPPLLRALGMRRKLKLGRWFAVAFRLFRRARRLRGTPLDPFGHTAVRRVERALPAEYLRLLDTALEGLSPRTFGLALEAAELADLVRGYEEIKLEGVRRFRERATQIEREIEEVRAATEEVRSR